MLATSSRPPASAFHLRAWPIIYATLLMTVLAVAYRAWRWRCSAAIFIVELAPASVRRVMMPVVRLLASVPSVIWGLIGVLVLVPFVGNHLITTSERDSLLGTVQLTGAGPARGGGRAGGDDHADHDRADLRRARGGARSAGARVRPRSASTGRARSARSTLRAIRPGDRRRHGARHGARAGRGDHDLDGLRLAFSRRSRATG